MTSNNPILERLGDVVDQLIQLRQAVERLTEQLAPTSFDRLENVPCPQLPDYVPTPQHPINPGPVGTGYARRPTSPFRRTPHSQ
jgi:hypothetical protein